MKLRPVSRLLGVAGLATFLASPALAQDTGHYYGGASIGQSRTEMDTSRTTGILLPGVAATGAATDKTGNAFKVFGGYQINRNLAIEGGYFDLGKNGFTAATSPAGSLSGETRVQGINLDVVGTMPLTDRFSLQGRVGGQHAWSRDRFSGTGAASAVAPGSRHNDFNVKVGLGVQYEMTPAVWVRGDVERYRIKDTTGRRANVDVASVSLVFPFGRAPAPRVAAAPAYVAPTPMPAPLQAPIAVVEPPAPVVVAPAPPAPQRVTFSADALFGFDKASVRPDGQTELDRFSQQLNGTTYESIRVEGHTDRLGTSEYNQTLSEERAMAVKNHLVTSGKLDPAKISTVGKGEAEPVTSAGACSDRQVRSRLIDCLQPDRRVEVQVTGTR